MFEPSVCDIWTPEVAAADGPEDAGKKLQILGGAARVFRQDGYEGASMSRIAAEAGVSKGTLYNYFPGKAELFTAFVQRSCARLIARVFDDLDMSGSAEATLLQIGRRMAAMTMSEPALLMHRMVVAEAEKFPALAETFFACGPARGIAHLSAYLRRATDQGLLAVEDCDFAAEQFLALIQAKLQMRRLLRLAGTPTDEEVSRVVLAGVRLFIRGYSP